jgi:hypothetical protein
MLGVCTALPLALFPEIVLRWTGAQENVANEAAGYFQLFAASAPFVVMSAVSTATFRSLSDTRIGEAKDHDGDGPGNASESEPSQGDSSRSPTHSR